MKLKDYLVIIPVSLLCQLPVLAQITVDTTATPAQLAQLLSGPGVTISNVTYYGAPGAKGTFSGNSNLGMSSGVVLSTGKADSLAGPNNRATISHQYNNVGDSELSALINNLSTYDAAVLEFDIVPQFDTLRFRYVFGSDEYPEYISSYNDPFAFFISGPGITGKPNLALIPGTSLPVTMQNVNPSSYSSYYVDNGTGSTPQLNTTIQYDGFTVVITAAVRVIPCKKYRFKIVIADGKDYIIDSGVLLEANSFSSKPSATTICSGSSTIIGVASQPGYTFSWTPSTGLVHPDSAHSILSLVNNSNSDYTTNYVLKAVSSICTFYDTFPVTVKHSITSTFTRSAKTCLGNSALINYTGNAPPNSTYAWGFDGGNIISGSGSGPYKISWSTPGYKKISLKVTSGLCNSVTTIDSVLVMGPLDVTARPDTTICHGMQLQLGATSSGGDTAGHFFTWQYSNFPNTVWNGLGTGRTLNVSPGLNTVYRVILSDNCSVAPDTSYVNITVRAPLNLNPTNDTIICKGQKVTLRVKPSGGLPASYHLQWDNGLSSNNSHNIIPAATTAYRAILTDGCSLADTALINVIVRAPLKLVPLPDTTICSGQNLHISVSATGGDSLNYTFGWDNGMSSGNNKLLTPTGNTTYRVDVYDNCSDLGDTDYFTVTVRSPLEVIARPDTLICQGQSVRLSAQTMGGLFSSYLLNWDNNAGSGNNLSVSPMTTTTYKVVLTDNCSPGDTDHVKIEVRYPLAVTPRQDTTICLGQSVLLSAFAGGGNITGHQLKWEELDASGNNGWTSAGQGFLTVTPAGTTQYRVILTDGCTASPDTGYVTITVRDALELIPRSDSTICIGQGLKLFASASGGMSQRYVLTWDHGLGTGKVKMVAPSVTTTYRVVLTDNCSLNPDTAYITVTVRQPLSIQPPSDTTICYGQKLKLIAGSSGGNSASHVLAWDNGAGTGNSVLVTPTQAITYLITLTDNCTDGEDTASVRVNVRLPLKVRLNYDSVSVCAGEALDLVANGYGGKAGNYSFTWNNNLGTGISKLIYPLVTATYQVVLSDGCTPDSDSASVKVIVRPPLQVTARKDTFMCNGESTVLFSTAKGGESSAYHFSWYTYSAGDWEFLDFGNNIPVTPAVTTRYMVILSDGCSANDSAEVIVNIRTPVKLSLTRDTTVCKGQSVDLVVSGAGNDSIYYSYFWDQGLGTGNYKTVIPPNTTTYQLLVRDNCAVTTDTLFVTIIVRDSLRLFPRSDTTICRGQQVKLTASATGGDNNNYIFFWHGNGVISNGFVSPDTTTTYRVMLTDNCSPGPESAFVKVTVRPQLVLMPQPDTTICYGQSLLLNANGVGGYSPGYHYSWNNGMDTGSNIVVQPLATSVYQVVLSDNCTSVPDTLRITVNVRDPLVVTSNRDTVICKGQKVILQASGTGGIPPDHVFKWSHLANPASSVIVNPNSTTTYRVVLTDNCSFIGDTEFVKVTVRFGLMVNAGKDSLICAGGSVNLVAKALGGNPASYDYNWEGFINGGWTLISPFGSGASVNVSPAKSTLYRVVLKDYCTVKADTDYVWIFVRSPLDVKAGQDTTICLGQSMDLSAIASGGKKSYYSYEWNNGLGNSAMHTVSPAVTTKYRVILSDNCSMQSDTDEIIVSVRAPLSIAVPSDTIICEGQSVKLQVAGKGGMTSNYVYTWDNGLSTGNIKTVSPLQSTTYRVILTDNCSSIPDTAFIKINVRQPLAITPRPDTTICTGQKVVMFATASGGSSDTYKFSWNNGLGNSNFTQVAPAASTVYRVILTDNCSSKADTAEITINVRKPLKANPGPASSICHGKSVQLFATGTGGDSLNYTFNWSHGLGTGNSHPVSPAQTTNYRVILTDNCSNKADTAYVQVSVKDPLKVDAMKFAQICEGEELLIYADASGGDYLNYIYSWDNGIGEVRSTKIKPSKTTTYKVTVKDGCSLPATDTVTVQLFPLPSVDFSVDANRICAGEMVRFINNSKHKAGNIYSWHFNDNQHSNEKQPEMQFAFPGVYSASLKVVSEHGCTDSLSREEILTVNPLPEGQFIASPGITNILSPIIQFDNFTEGAVRYDWDMGDGKGSSNLKSMNYEYHDTGNFRVKLVAFNDFGCVDTVIRPVRIADVYRFFVPNAFSPNGDDLNETFHPVGMGIISYETSIYNRWGQLVFASTDRNFNWNGKYFNTGEMVTQEIYQYTFKVVDFEGKSHFYQGSVMVMPASSR